MSFRILAISLLFFGSTATAAEVKCAKAPAPKVTTDAFTGVTQTRLNTWVGDATVVEGKLTFEREVLLSGVHVQPVPIGWFLEFKLVDGTTVRAATESETAPVLIAEGGGYTRYTMTLHMAPEDFKKLGTSPMAARRFIKLDRLDVFGSTDVPADAWEVYDLTKVPKWTAKQQVVYQCDAQKLKL